MPMDRCIRRDGVNGRHEMTRVRVESFTISLDGYGAGPGQDIDSPLGIGGTDLHQSCFGTVSPWRIFRC